MASKRLQALYLPLTLFLAFLILGCSTSTQSVKATEPKESLAGQYHELSTDDPNIAGWLIYVNGLDLKENCKLGQPDKYRLIRNGDKYNQTVRAMDVYYLNEREGAILLMREVQAQEMSDVSVFTGLRNQEEKRQQKMISAHEFSLIERELEQMGTFTPAPQEKLPSTEVGMMVSGCHQGSYFLTVWSTKSTLEIPL